MIDESNISLCAGECLLPVMDERFNTTVQEYVEVIRDLTHESPVARVKEIADRRGVTRSSVSTALISLRQFGLVEHEHYGYVALTERGKELGALLQRRHAVILCFLHDILGVEKQAADSEACRLEHSMTRESLDALIVYVSRIEGCPLCGSKLKTERVFA